MLKNFIKTAWRNILRNKAFSLINISGLSLGLACVMLIILYVKDEVSFDRFNTKADRTYRIVSQAAGPDGEEHKSGITGGIHADVFKSEIPEIESFCRITGASGLVKKGAGVMSERGLFADNSFFSVFTFPLIEGNAGAGLLNEPNNIVLSESMAKKYFGNTNAVGKTLQINESGKFEAFTITAVAKEPPVNSSIRFAFLIPIKRQLKPQSNVNDWFNSWLNSFIVLKRGADPSVVKQKMAAIFESHAGKRMAEFRKQYSPKMYVKYDVQPFLVMHLDKENYSTGNGLAPSNTVDYSYILGGIAIFILIIACINFINLTLSRSLRRGKEIGIRKVSGSSRAQLIWQFIGEAFILTVFASLLAILLVKLSLPFFNELSGKNLQALYLVEPQTITLFVLLILVNTILSGFYPAIVLSGFNPVQTLYGKLKISGKNYLGKSLVVVQLTIAVFLSIGTIVMQKQFNFLLHKDLGYTADSVLSVDIPGGKAAELAVLKSEMSKHAFVKQVAVQSNPFTSFTGTVFKGNNNKELFSTPFFKVDDQFLSMLKIGLVSGHNFSGRADTSTCLVNQSFVKAMGWKGSPIGERIEGNDSKYTIIGVTKDFHSSSLQYAITPLVLMQDPKQEYGVLLLKLNMERKTEAIAAVQKLYKQLIPDQPCNYTFLSDMLADQYTDQNRWKQMISIASCISIFISCMGLFGLATLSIEQRVKEIGIRKVLGASSPAIVQLLSFNYVKLLLLSLLIASPLAWYIMYKWLQDFPYRIEMNGWILVMASAGSLLIVLLTVGFQAARASVANPVKSLRSE
jgi:putative ABC transport system permease protein